MTRATALLACALLGCTESPDVVAVAQDSTASGGMSGSGGMQQTPNFDDLVDGGSFFACEEQALATERIPDELVFVSIRCWVPIGALQADEAERLEAIQTLLDTNPDFSPEPGFQWDGLNDPPGCFERGLWWIEGERIHLCRDLCQGLHRWLSASLDRVCPEQGE